MKTKKQQWRVGEVLTLADRVGGGRGGRMVTGNATFLIISNKSYETLGVI
jgi:hypothetical protein